MRSRRDEAGEPGRGQSSKGFGGHAKECEFQPESNENPLMDIQAEFFLKDSPLAQVIFSLWSYLFLSV